MAIINAADIAPGLRFHQVLSDNMQPTIHRLDYVLISPVHRYDGEGYYLISQDECVWVYSCNVTYIDGTSMIRLRSHFPSYPDRVVSRAEFDDRVLAAVVMTCNVQRPDILRDATKAEV